MGYNCVCNSGWTGDGFTCTEQFLVLTYQERYWYGADYEEHRILIGPSTSTDPEDGTWTELADGTDLDTWTADYTWEQGLVLDIDAMSGQSVRIAFHYLGTTADKWYLEDICIGWSDDGIDPPSACEWDHGFDNGTVPTLPSDWTSVSGATDTYSSIWRTSTDQWISWPTSALIDRTPNSSTVQDEYLVSDPITLP